MAVDKVLVTSRELIEAKHQNVHPGYEYFKKTVASGAGGNKCNVALYEIPPLKSAYPYHYHHQAEEVFYIISGCGTLRTPEGSQAVSAGDILFFPSGADGAHKLTNSSATEMLVYIDFDTYHNMDCSHMPDSKKSVVIGQGLRRIIKDETDAEYYEGE